MTPPSNSLPIRALRFSRLLLHVMRGVATAGLLFPIYCPEQRDQAIVRWARKLLAILHIQLELRGDVPAANGGCILVVNHVSWLDVFVVHTVQPARFVAKSEIRAWPIAGWLCARAGTLFIERGRRHHTASINELMRDVVTDGGIVGLFPEGTTTLGDHLKKFHSSLFQAAVESEAPLVPAALRYTDPRGQRSTVPAYVDEMSLLQSVNRVIAAPALRVILHFAPATQTAGKNRRELARQTADAIGGLLYPEQST